MLYEESDNVLYDYYKEHYHEIENQELYNKKVVDDFFECYGGLTDEVF